MKGIRNEKEYNNKSQTAVLYACKMREAEDENSKKEINTARLLAEEQASQAEEEFRRASAEAERLAEAFLPEEQLPRLPPT